MTLEEIAALPVRELADPAGCRVYMWTTNRYLQHAWEIFDAWGVRYGQTLVWCKAPMGAGLGGDFQISTEFIVSGRIGAPKRTSERVDTTWFRWPRMGKAHSRKPEAFLDLVERVSDAPRLEMFARRNRLGWDTWGNESHEHVQIEARRPALTA
jgi:N6-adenosine-specific RNA methylase IME4